MSSGDIDDRLGPPGKVDDLRKTSQGFDLYMSSIDSIPIKRAGVPYGAGISTDGRTCYVDDRLVLILNGVDVSPALRTHECVEWALREYFDIGWDYHSDPSGHRLANRAEYEEVGRLFPDQDPDDAWEAYDDFVDPQIRNIEHEDVTNVPKDLALYPYEHTAIFRRIKEAQRGTN